MLLKNIVNHYKNTKDVKVYPCIGFSSICWPVVCKTESGKKWVNFLFYAFILFLISEGKIATNLEKKPQFCISRFTQPLLFSAVLSAFLSAEWCPPSHPSPISSLVPGTFLLPSFLGWGATSCLFCLLSLTFASPLGHPHSI